MTLVASALAGGDCIDDADVLRTGGTGTLGGTVKAPSTLGTFLRSFRWGHVRQLDRVSRELLARAWAAPVDLLHHLRLAKEGGTSASYQCWPLPGGDVWPEAANTSMSRVRYETEKMSPYHACLLLQAYPMISS